MDAMGRVIVRDRGGVPLERGAELVVTLASGRADGLTGRFISVRDDLETLIRRVDDIRGKDLYRVRLRRE
jgi:hypothetical protein